MKQLLLIGLEAVLGILTAYLMKRMTGEHYSRPALALEDYFKD